MLRISSNLSLPDEITGRRTGVFGISGSGKSNSATVIVEQALDAGEQVVLIDPKGEGWGLLSLANGKPSGFDVIIFGEPNGHIPELTEHHGGRLADFVVDSGRSIVLSMLGFESDASERRFVATFLRQLYRRKTKQTKRTRTLVVFEEAHLFMPEGAGRGLKGDTAELSGACQRIVRQGRSFGIGSLIIDQRPQDVAKRIVTQLDTLVCHQLVHKLDRDALKDWVAGHADVKQAKEFFDSLASLQPGEAWVWSPAWLKIFKRVKVDRRRSFDSGAAPDDSSAVQVQRKSINLESLKSQLADMVEQAKANDPKELRRRIAELERQVKSGTVDINAIAAAEQRGHKAGYAEAQADIRQLQSAVADRNGRLSKIEQLAHLNGDVDAGRVFSTTLKVFQKRQSASENATPEKRTTIAPLRQSRPTGDSSAFGKCELAILRVLAQYGDGCTAGKLALLSGYRFSGGFRNSLSTLRTAGLIEGSNTGTMRITDAGRAADNFEPLPTGPELAEYWLTHSSFGKCERAILAALIEHPEGLEAAALADETGYEFSGGFRNALSTLRTAGVLIGRNTEVMRASEELL